MFAKAYLDIFSGWNIFKWDQIMGSNIKFYDRRGGGGVCLIKFHIPVAEFCR